MRRKTGPVQQWVDSIPAPGMIAIEAQSGLDENPTPPLTPVSSKESNLIKANMRASTPIMVPSSPIITKTGVSSPVAHNLLARDPSFQSDSSHCSSVESLLELRRADPEAILLGLGFGGCPNNGEENGPLSRIPKRFLQPSKLQGITLNDFVKHEQETSESLDSASLGYRGLTGSPYVAPSEIVQKIMERLREHESHEHDAYTNVYNANIEPCTSFSLKDHSSRLSVLSPDNRQYLERPRSKSPDMRNKRMIIGQKSFAFGCDGDLIEIESTGQLESVNLSTNDNMDNHEIELENEYDDAAIPNDSRSIVSVNFEIDKELFLEKSENNGKVVSCEMRDCESDHQTNGQATSDRRSSLDACDTKKASWVTLTRDEKRRHSDGSLNQTTSLLNRRKSFKRQSRISDVEYSDEETPGFSERTRLEDKETDRLLENKIDDTLSTIEREQTVEKFATLDNAADTKDSSKKKRDKRGHGVSTILGMYNSVMSIKMEPGF